LLRTWGYFCLDGAASDHVHRAEDDLPRKVHCGPEVAVEDAERARIAPDGADGTREGHECAHLVARGARSEVGGDLGGVDMREGTGSSAGAAGASSREHSGGNGEERSHEAVEAVRDEECVKGREGLSVRHDEGHNGNNERAVGARLGARDGQARDVGAVRGENNVVSRDEENRV
jgi:hypothetical protein